MSVYLGIDGGGTKTRFMLIDHTGRVLATHLEGSTYYLETGLDVLGALLSRGIAQVLERGGVREAELAFAFLGIPAYGEDSTLLATLDAIPRRALPSGRYRCGNDMVCAWAGALGGTEGINVVAGTGSIAYGEYQGRSARAGGWGELIGDEGSAHWLAREGLRLFSRMSDGRAPRGELYARVRQHFNLGADLDLCAAINAQSFTQRSRFAQLSKLMSEAALAGDTAARGLFTQAARELADLVDAVRVALRVPVEEALPVSCTGSLFTLDELLRVPFEAALSSNGQPHRLVPARLAPAAGAALYAAKLGGAALDERAIARLGVSLQEP